MKFILCFDSFKESLSASNAVQAAYEGWSSVFPQAHYECIPLSDGGEGLIESIAQSLGGQKKYASVLNAIGNTTKAKYLWINENKTAIIESAQAIGLEQIPIDNRNPMLCSSFGLGQLLKKVHMQGAKKIIIGLGGSATIDGGIGMLQALGFSLLDSTGKEIAKGGKYLGAIQKIDSHNAHSFDNCTLQIASDVKNPLLGTQGAVMVFGAQKGASSPMQTILEKGMHNFAQKLQKHYAIIKKQFNTQGYGAAGGLGASLNICCNAEIHSGIETVLATIEFSKKIKNASLAISGEGKIDLQSFFGKVPWGVLTQCKKQKIPLCLISGTVGKGYTKLYEQGVQSIFTIHKELLDPIKNWAKIKKISYNQIRETTRDIAYIFKYGTIKRGTNIER